MCAIRTSRVEVNNKGPVWGKPVGAEGQTFFGKRERSDMQERIDPNWRKRISRRQLLVGAGASAVLVGLGACGPSQQQASESTSKNGVPQMPERPVDLTVIDVAGNLQLTKGMMEDYVSEHSDVISRVNYTEATSPELPGKIKAQQQADQVNIALALTGSDGLSSGIGQDLWFKLTPNYEKKFPDLMQNYIEPRAQELAQGFGILLVYGNFGPTFTYNPEKISTPPKTADEMLQYAKSNPGQFMYARPANSGPGRSLLMGLPYILGDSDPKNPESWDNTWSYLQEIGQFIDYYPSGTTPTMEQLGNGSRSVVASTMGWDMNPRFLGVVPKGFGAFALEGLHPVADAQYGVIPKGLDAGRLAVTLDLLSWMLRPEQQAKAYDEAYFYPGPTVKDVTLDMAPQESQKAVRSVFRPEFKRIIEDRPVEMPLDATSLVKAFEIWDERVGSGKIRE